MNICPALVRREDELLQLTSSLGSGGLFLVTGEAGIGKSRLLKALADEADDRGISVLWGRPEVLSDPGPYSIVAGLLDEAATRPRLRQEASEILDILGGAVEVQPRQVAARIRGLFSKGERPPLVLFEDLHDADELSLAVIAHLSRAASDDQVTMVGTFRPDASPALGRVLDVFERDRLATFIPLEPLDRGAVGEMLKLMWDREPSADELDRIARMAEGIPFLAEELAASGGDAVPESVLRAVEARLGRLAGEARRVVEVASLVVGAIDPGLIAAAGGIDEDHLGEHLVAAVRVGLLADREGRLLFRHGLLRKAVSEGMVSVDRAELHRRLAAEIQGRASDPNVHAAALTRHCFEAGDHEAAARWAVVAGTRALNVAALDEAASQFHLAVEVAKDANVRRQAQEGLSEIAYRINPRDQARWERLALEFEEAGDAVAAARCWLRRAEVERLTAGGDAALPIFQRAVDLLSEDRHAGELAQALIEMAAASQSAYGGQAASAHLERGLELARSAGRVDLAATALVGLGACKAMVGALEEALALEERGCEAALTTEKGSVISKVFKQHAWTLLYAGRGDDALAALNESEVWARRHVGDASALSINVRRAYLFVSTGQPQKAATAAAQLGASSSADDLVALARFYALLEGEGDDEARAYLDAWWEVQGGPAMRAVCLEDPSKGLEEYPAFLAACLAEMMIATSGEGAPPWWPHITGEYCRYYSSTPPTTKMDILTMLSRAAMRLGLPEMMEHLLEEMKEPLREAPYPPYLAARRQLEGAHLAAVGADSAQEVLWDAVRRFSETNNAVESARCAVIALRAEVTDSSRIPKQMLTEVLVSAEAAGASVQHARLEALMRAHGIRTRAGRPRGRPRAPEGSLSVREEEVAVLVAAGATNAEVARRLVLSERTVEDHISRAQRRLGVTGRAGLAAWAAKRGLV